MKLSIQGIACDRGDRPVFRDVSLDLPAGRVAHVRGANGSGKSSLLAILAGLLRPSAGDGRLGDLPLGSAAFRANTAYAGHRDALKPTLTLRENLTAWVRILGGRAESIDDAVERYALGPVADTQAGLCSAGERQRAALARVLTLDRPFWVLDEPAATLDSNARETLAGTIADHAHSGGSAVIALHGDLAPEPESTIRLGGPELEAPGEASPSPIPPS